MLHRYQSFFIYVGFVLVASLSRMAVAVMFGQNSPHYYYIYHVPTFVMPLLQIWILWDIRNRIVGYTKTSWNNSFRLTMIAGVLTIPVLWAVFSLGRSASVFEQYHTVTLFLQMTLCLLVCREASQAREALDLGQNLKGILSGLALMIGCQAINFVGFTFAQSSAQTFWFFVQFIYFLALIVFTYTLWDYIPAAPVDPSYHQRLEKTNEELYEVLKSVLLNRK